MKLKFGIFDGNIVDIAFRISTVFRIETFDKIFKGVEIILKFLPVDLVPVILPDAVSGKQVDRRGADFDRARRNNAAQQRADTERNGSFGRINDESTVIFFVDDIVGNNLNRLNGADQFQINGVNRYLIFGIVMIESFDDIGFQKRHGDRPPVKLPDK